MTADPNAAPPGRVQPCNHCHDQIRWLTTGDGKPMPVNADPDPARGNVVVVGGRAGVLGKAKAAAARGRGVQMFLHHAVTCPHRRLWQTR